MTARHEAIIVRDDEDCDWCGYPLGTGDRAVVLADDPDGPAFCGSPCAARAADRNRS